MKRCYITSTTFLLLILAGYFSSCNTKMEVELVEEEEAVPEIWQGYDWPAGKKYYYGFEEKIYLDEVPNKVVFGFDDNYLLEIKRYLQENVHIVHIDLQIFNKICILTTTENSDVTSLLEDLRKLEGVKSAHPVYMLSDFISPEIFLNDEVIMQFKYGVTLRKMEEVHKVFHVRVKEITDYWQILIVPVDADILGVANAYQESGLVIYSKPNFFSEIEISP